MGFRMTKGIERAGWRVGCGDALRARGKCLAVLMLPPTPSTPLTRIRVNGRSALLEIRVHTSTRCTRGSWLQVSTQSVRGFKATDWARLTRHWAWYITEYGTTREGWDWAHDSGKDENRCLTRTNANSHFPCCFNIGRGRICKDRPSSEAQFGFTPASGKRVQTHTFDGK